MAKLGRKNKMRMKKKSLSSKQTKAVKAIVKKTVAQSEETKYFPYTAVHEPLLYQLTSWNLFYHGAAHGTNNNQFIGDKLNWRGVCVKWTAQNVYLDVNYIWVDQPILFDLYIIASDIYKTTSSLTLADISTSTNTTNPSLFFADPGTKILYKKTHSITLDRGNATVQRKTLAGKIWLKRNQMLTFNDFTKDRTFKNGKNYYFAVVNKSASGLRFTLDFTWQNYFKDA